MTIVVVERRRNAEDEVCAVFASVEAAMAALPGAWVFDAMGHLLYKRRRWTRAVRHDVPEPHTLTEWPIQGQFTVEIDIRADLDEALRRLVPPPNVTHQAEPAAGADDALPTTE